MIVKIKIGMPKGQQPVHLQLRASRGDVLAMIGIGNVGSGRCKKRDFRYLRPTLPIAPWANKKREVTLARGAFVACSATDVQRIRAALDILRQRDAYAGVPSGVIDVVMVKVNRIVVLRLAPPFML